MSRGLYGNQKPATVIALCKEKPVNIGPSMPVDVADVPVGVFVDMLHQQPKLIDTDVLLLDELFLTRFGQPNLPAQRSHYPSLTKKIRKIQSEIEKELNSKSSSKRVKTSEVDTIVPKLSRRLYSDDMPERRPGFSEVNVGSRNLQENQRIGGFADRPNMAKAGIGSEAADVYEAYRQRRSTTYHKMIQDSHITKT